MLTELTTCTVSAVPILKALFHKGFHYNVGNRNSVCYVLTLKQKIMLTLMGFFLKCITDAPPFLEYVEQSLLLTCMMTIAIDYLVLLPSYSIVPFGTILSGPQCNRGIIIYGFTYIHLIETIYLLKLSCLVFTYFSSLCSSDNILLCTSFNTPCKVKI